jgi:uncharacterized protein YeeX (DUF496 family)
MYPVEKPLKTVIRATQNEKKYIKCNFTTEHIKQIITVNHSNWE